jgi:hypothetical protein
MDIGRETELGRRWGEGGQREGGKGGGATSAGAALQSALRGNTVANTVGSTSKKNRSELVDFFTHCTIYIRVHIV